MPVHYELHLADPRFRPLSTPGGVVLITQAETSIDALGLGGLIVVRSPLEADRFFAYDLACPLEHSREHRLHLDELEAVCETCHSHFDLLSGHGAPLSGPAESPLGRYRALYDRDRGVVSIRP